MTRQNDTHSLRLLLPLGGAIAFFLIGWLGGWMVPSASRRPPVRAVPVARPQPPAPAPTAPKSTRDSFHDRIAKAEQKARTLAGRTRGEWIAAWNDAVRQRNLWSLANDWAETDPHGALATAFDAGRHPPDELQERYDHEYLGRTAINRLFRSDVPAAMAAVQEWRNIYGSYPYLDCLHLLVAGTDEQKAALKQLLSAQDPSPVIFLPTGAPLQVLDALLTAPEPAPSGTVHRLIGEIAASNPAEAAAWLEKHPERVSADLLRAALGGLHQRQHLAPSQGRIDAFGRMLALAPTAVADRYAAEYARQLAAVDAEAARHWAEEHVPEGELPGALREVESAAAKNRNRRKD